MSLCCPGTPTKGTRNSTLPLALPTKNNPHCVLHLAGRVENEISVIWGLPPSPLLTPLGFCGVLGS